MHRRRLRLFTLFAALIIFLLYRVAQSSWDPQPPSPIPPSRQPPPPQFPPVIGADGSDSTLPNHGPKPNDPSLPLNPVQDFNGQQVPPNGQRLERKPGQELPLRPGHPSDGPDTDFPSSADDVRWVRQEERFPVPKGSLIPLPTGPARSLPKIQYRFGRESAAAKKKRLQRQARVKAELERAWAGYRNYAWMHDELSPISRKNRDPFCGWAATLVDSLDTLWIAGLRKEFDEAAQAARAIDFARANRHEIPVFETTIRYLGGLIAAFDVSGGHQGSYRFLLDKAVELAEILMSVFDTPNRMPLLQYQWKPEFASQPRRPDRVGIAELGSLSLEFTRLAQLTKENKYYDAVDRITNALVDLQKAGTLLPGLFPTDLDASGCNRTASLVQSSVGLAAKQQITLQEPLEEPRGYAKEGSNPPLGSILDSNRRQEDDAAHPDGRLDRRQLPPLPPVAPGRSDTEGPLAADGSQVNWDCVPQGLIPYESLQTFHVGGAQDSAYEYFAKQYQLLRGRETKYQKLYEDAIEAINNKLLYRPMIQGDWDILFPAKVQTAGDPSTDLRVEYEVAHLTCFVGGMYGLGGKLFGRKQDVETAQKLAEGCVWAYQSTYSGIMPEFARVVPCPSLERCKFNESQWWDAMDPEKDSRDAAANAWQAERENKDQKPPEGPPLPPADDKAPPPPDIPAPPPPPPPPADDKTAAPAPGGDDKAGPATSDVKAEPPKVEPPKAEPPKEEPPKAEPPKAEPPKAEPPKAEPPKEEPPKEEPPKAETPKEEAKPLQKRDASEQVDSRATTDSMAKAETGSQLPPSLKKKLGMGPGQDENDKWPSLEEPKEPLQEPVKAFEDMAGDGGDGGDEHPSGVPLIPELQAARGASEQKPLSHAEYIKQRMEKDHIPPGFASVNGPHYILRPEAIEAVWYMYRITGDDTWQDKGWDMFKATVRATRTPIANSAVRNVLTAEPELSDEMESFWIAETLKYYYLLFSEPDLISLDEWVLNTEAHPFKL